MDRSEEKTWAMGAHLMAFLGFFLPFGNLIGPLIFYLWKRQESEFVADQAMEALNFQLTVTIAFLLGFMALFIVIGVVLLPLIAIANIVFIIIAALKANQGERYRYPYTLRLLSD